MKELEELRIVHKNLMGLHKEDKGSLIEYKAEEGRIIAYGILQRDDVTVSDVFLKKDSKFTWHEHKVLEVMIVYNGEVTFEREDGIVIKVGKDKPVYFSKFVPHRILNVTEDSNLIVVTVPSEEGLPNARE